MKVAIDCDGVLANFNFNAAQVVNAIKPRTIPQPLTFTPTTPNWITPDIYPAFRNRVQNSHNWWLYLDAYFENISALNRFLADYPYIVYIVTSRFPTEGLSVEQQTQMWLLSCGVETHPRGYIGVISTPKKYKAQVMEACRFDYSIDDNADIVRRNNEFAGKSMGHKSYILDRPWNQDSTEPRVRTLEEFFRMVNNEQRKTQSAGR